MRTAKLLRAGWVTGGLLGILVISACQDDRASIFQPVGPVVKNFAALSAGATASFPSGAFRVVNLFRDTVQYDPDSADITTMSTASVPAEDAERTDVVTVPDTSITTTGPDTVIVERFAIFAFADDTNAVVVREDETRADTVMFAGDTAFATAPPFPIPTDSITIEYSVASELRRDGVAVGTVSVGDETTVVRAVDSVITRPDAEVIFPEPTITFQDTVTFEPDTIVVTDTVITSSATTVTLPAQDVSLTRSAPLPAHSAVITRGPAVRQRPNVLTAREPAVRYALTNLAPLASGLYQIWIANADMTDLRSLTGRVVAYARDEEQGTIDSTVIGTASTFNPPATPYDSIRVEVLASDHAVDPHDFDIAFVSLEASEATSPNDAGSFLWRRGGGGSWTFGIFGGDDAANDIEFIFAGTGRGGVRGDELSVDFQGLPRPPEGFAYEGWLFRANGSGVKFSDLTTIVPVESGPVERVSLRDADDRTQSFPNTSPTRILTANVRTFEDALGEAIGNFVQFQLVLVPKQSTTEPKSFMFLGELPT